MALWSSSRRRRRGCLRGSFFLPSFCPSLSPLSSARTGLTHLLHLCFLPSSTPIVNDEFLEHIRQGRITYKRGDTKSIVSRGVKFVERPRGSKSGDAGDEGIERADVLIVATGYKRPEIKFLPDDLFPREGDRDYHPPSLFLQNFSTSDWSVLLTNASYQGSSIFRLSLLGLFCSLTSPRLQTPLGVSGTGEQPAFVLSSLFFGPLFRSSPSPLPAQVQKEAVLTLLSSTFHSYFCSAVSRRHIGILTRVLLVFLLDKSTRPSPISMKTWVDAVTWIKKQSWGDDTSGLAFFTVRTSLSFPSPSFLPLPSSSAIG